MLALVGFGTLFVRNVEGYQDWPEGSAVPHDGMSHVVDVEPGETFYLWAYVMFSDVDCQVADGRTGATVDLREPAKQLIRSAGAAHFEALLQGTALSGQVAVTCATAADYEPVHVDALNGPYVVDNLGPRWPVPAALAVVGAALLLVAGALGVLRRS